MNADRLEVCILAAGVGSRMKSDGPKVLQPLAGRPLLSYLLDTVSSLSPFRVHVVVGKGGDEVRDTFRQAGGINWVEQVERLGTGHAVMQAVPHLEDGSRLLVLLGDTPLVRPETLRRLAGLASDLSVLSVLMPDPTGYGRIVRNGDRVTRIVEEADATDEQKRIREVNTGVMVADVRFLKSWLRLLTNDNAQSEYLLTDIVEQADKGQAKVIACIAENPDEVAGINSFVQLSALERKMQKTKATELMEQGVQIIDPARFDLRGTLKAGTGVRVDINVILEGRVELGDKVTIGPNVVIRDAIVGAGTEIKANSLVEEATLGRNCRVGPFARLRPGVELCDEVHVGNFVEVKKTRLGKGSKANHLAYLGDSTLGEGVNIGAGTITCNYDGVNKHQTRIGDGAFIGSNASLVAPVSIGAGSTVGAGSTITNDVPSQALAVGRGKQKSISSWRRPAGKT